MCFSVRQPETKATWQNRKCGLQQEYKINRFSTSSEIVTSVIVVNIPVWEKYKCKISRDFTWYIVHIYQVKTREKQSDKNKKKI